MSTPLYWPPRLRTDESDRRATWLELFYDLVFAVAISLLGSELRNHVSWSALGRFLLLGIPIWWAWVGHTIYSTRFDTDDVVHRVLTFLQMLAAAAMASQLYSAFRLDTTYFAAAFVGSRMVLLALYLRARVHVPEARNSTDWLLKGFVVSDALWIVSIFVRGWGSYTLWGIALLFDLIAPAFGRKRVHPLPINSSHLAERFGLFTLVVMGYGIYAVVTSLIQNTRLPISISAAFLSFVIAAAIWWIYFGYMGAAELRPKPGSWQPFVYWHLPLTLSLVALASGLDRSIHQVDEPLLPGSTTWLIGGAACVWLISFGLVRIPSVRQPRVLKKTRIYFVAAVLAFAVSWLGLWLPSSVEVLLFACIFLGLAIQATRKDPAVDPSPQYPLEMHAVDVPQQLRGTSVRSLDAEASEQR